MIKVNIPKVPVKRVTSGSILYDKTKSATFLVVRELVVRELTEKLNTFDYGKYKLINLKNACETYDKVYASNKPQGVLEKYKEHNPQSDVVLLDPDEYIIEFTV